MHLKHVAPAVLTAAALTLPAAASAGVANGQIEPATTGPSSSQAPYIVPTQKHVGVTSVLSVGDTVTTPAGAPYRMAGIADGLGAFDNADGTFTLLMNHELPSAAGAVRAHGATGAFVSKWTIAKDDLRVLHGEDLIRRIATWNPATGAYDAPATGIALNRLCSADLAAPTAYYNPTTGLGYDGRLFTNGEESSGGRAFAHAMDGTSYELPALGKTAFENVVANPAAGDSTVVVATDDSTPGQVYVFHGRKRSAGSPVERAGLDQGALYGIKVPGMSDESTGDFVASGRFQLARVGDGDARDMSGTELEAASDAAGVTRFWRPEDASWDPTNPHVLYVTTTASFTAPSRLWKLTFDDPADPAKGGTIEAVLDGTEGQHMLDNLTVDGRGRVLAQEDPGNHPYLAKIRKYFPQQDRLTTVAEHDPARFAPGAPGFLTQDEESSGIVDVRAILGEGWFLGDVQAHYPLSGELVEGGQLFALYVPPAQTFGTAQSR
ncbi:alkaline phosphatase PhoX [Capillimicrobium parvum]|uniref:Phytase-like domain-containing protein n=1 Tax=Capillimicrobium parvum TaxID=2884022 RepID=A0A9E7BZQ4_9ACTN|nr:alkaline phosphatase PhoX [Capillimicrobium parvum]UGS35566.1 hypothetical protein DSM104329_01959 [Capillimicrobium parvum]